VSQHVGDGHLSCQVNNMASSEQVETAWAKLRHKPSSKNVERKVISILRGGHVEADEDAAAASKRSAGRAMQHYEDTSAAETDTIDDFTLPASCTMSPEDLEAASQRDLHKMTDASVSVRMAALLSLQVCSSQARSCMPGCNLDRLTEQLRPFNSYCWRQIAHLCVQSRMTETNLGKGVLGDAMSSWLGKALIKCFADASERARTLAVKTFHEGLKTCPDAAMPMLPYLVPVLVERLCKVDVSKHWREPVEELRSLLFTVRTSHGWAFQECAPLCA
jgi:hypothetical protein